MQKQFWHLSRLEFPCCHGLPNQHGHPLGSSMNLYYHPCLLSRDWCHEQYTPRSTDPSYSPTLGRLDSSWQGKSNFLTTVRECKACKNSMSIFIQEHHPLTWQTSTSLYIMYQESLWLQQLSGNHVTLLILLSIDIT